VPVGQGTGSIAVRRIQNPERSALAEPQALLTSSHDVVPAHFSQPQCSRSKMPDWAMR